MTRAHEIRKSQNVTLSTALRLSWSIAKLGGAETMVLTDDMKPLDITAQKLFRVRAMLDRLEKEETALEDAIKAAIAESGDDHISGIGWKASYKAVTSRRFDSKTFRADHAELYTAYSRPQTVNRFLFGAV